MTARRVLRTDPVSTRSNPQPDGVRSSQGNEHLVSDGYEYCDGG